MARFDELRQLGQNTYSAVATLVSGSDGSDPEPEAYSTASTEIRSIDSDVSWPEDEIEDYWRLYETNPLISGPIDRTATEVIEPGYWVEADSSKTEDELTEFLENVGIEGGKPKRDFSTVAQQAVVQHEVRGTFMGEKVTENDKHIAVNPVRSNTFKIHTKPDSNILIAPDDHRDGSNLKLDEDNKAAAFVQFDNEDVRFHNRRERRFTRDQILHWPRNPDIGDVRGTSRLEAVYERARALQAKLQDNDDAIAMKAWPMVLFQLGSEERPWTKDQMATFMERYEEGNLGPGMYHGVPGDVELEEFAGETADIGDAVSTDVDFVMSGMPGPRYSLGGFAEAVSTTVASAQERQYRKLVRGLRRDLEDLFTPYLVEVAESWDLDTEGIQLHIGRPDGEMSPDDVSGSIIRYTSDVSEGEGDDDQRPLQENTGGSSNDSSDNRAAPVEGDGEAEASVADLPDAIATPLETAECTATAELADPRLVNTDVQVDAMADAIETVLVRTRDRTLERFDGLFRNGATPRTRDIQSTVRSAYEDAKGDVAVGRVAQDQLQAVGESTVATLGQSTHEPTIDTVFGPSERQRSRTEATELVRDVDDVVDDMVSQIDAIVGAAQVGSVDRLRDRVAQFLDESTLSDRAQLIAHMHAQTLSNTIKLSAYQDHDDIVGVGVVNPCTESTTPLCRDLAGCDGDRATAYFNESTPIGEQLEGQTDADLFEGFDPLPALPPYHYGCNSAIVPVLE